MDTPRRDQPAGVADASSTSPRRQAACFVNVVIHLGNIVFRICDGIVANALVAVSDIAGDGWTYLHQASTGWGAHHRSIFEGDGSMKVALALPDLGTGDHGGAFIYAQSIGRYTHGEDRLPSGVRF